MSDPSPPTTTSVDEQRAALVDAACAWGWDRASTASSGAAAAQIAAAAPLAERDLVIACLVGDVDAARRLLDADPELVRRQLPPRDWEPLLYVSYCVLLAEPGDQTDRILAIARVLLERGA